MDDPYLAPMASGHLCLVVTEDVTWERFPVVVTETLRRIGGGTVRSRADGVDNRVWTVEHEGCEFCFAFQDYPIQASLESDSAEGDHLLKKFLKKLGASPGFRNRKHS